MPGFLVLHYLPEFAQTHVHWVSDVIKISVSVSPFSSCPRSFPASGSFPISRFFGSGSQNFGASALPSVFPMNQFSSVQLLSPVHSNEYSALISFRIDWFDLFAVQGTLKSLLQHHSSKTSSFQWSAFCIIQLSHPYITTGKTKALTIQTFVGKVMSLLFNTLSRFVIIFLPRSKCLLI